MRYTYCNWPESPNNVLHVLCYACQSIRWVLRKHDMYICHNGLSWPHMQNPDKTKLQNLISDLKNTSCCRHYSKIIDIIYMYLLELDINWMHFFDREFIEPKMLKYFFENTDDQAFKKLFPVSIFEYTDLVMCHIHDTTYGHSSCGLFNKRFPYEILVRCLKLHLIPDLWLYDREFMLYMSTQLLIADFNEIVHTYNIQNMHIIDDFIMCYFNVQYKLKEFDMPYDYYCYIVNSVENLSRFHHIILWAPDYIMADVLFRKAMQEPETEDNNGLIVDYRAEKLHSLCQSLNVPERIFESVSKMLREPGRSTKSAYH